MVSIVMPVKDAEPFLRKCLDSIVDQTYLDWELIAVNDQSADSTPEILQEYAEQDERIKTFDNPGNGIIDALIHAYSKSSGEYISRMDADDIMTFEKIESLVDTFKESREHVATAKVNYFGDGDPLGPGFRRYEQWLSKLCDTNTHYDEIYKECVIPSPCWMMHRSTLEKIGGFENSVYPEDYDLVFRLYKHKIEVKSVPKILHYWRDHQNRASRTDENYADNSFLDLKINYFLELDYNSFQRLFVWGAGKKGKLIAQALINKEIAFEWICENPNKIGKDIYGKILRDASVDFQENDQIIFLVANPDEQEEIKQKLGNASGMRQYWFC